MDIKTPLVIDMPTIPDSDANMEEVSKFCRGLLDSILSLIRNIRDDIKNLSDRLDAGGL